DMNQLNSDAHAIGGASNAALEEIVSVQLFPDLAWRYAAAFVLHNRTTGNDTQALWIQLAKLGDHLFGQAVAKELLVRITTQVVKGQYRQDCLFRRWCGADCRPMHGPIRQSREQKSGSQGDENSIADSS